MAELFSHCRKQSNSENSKHKTQRDPSGRKNIARTLVTIKIVLETTGGELFS